MTSKSPGVHELAIRAMREQESAALGRWVTDKRRAAKRRKTKRKVRR